MKYAAVHGAFLRSAAASASDAAVGAWVRLLALASELEAQDGEDGSCARIEGAAEWNDRALISASGTDRAGLTEAAEAGLVRIDGADVVVRGYDSNGHAKVKTARENGKFGRLGGRPTKKPEPKPVRVTNENPIGFQNETRAETLTVTPSPLPTSPFPTSPSPILPSSPPAQPREEPPTTPESGWTATRQSTRFIAAFERSQRTTPGMGGKTVGGFHRDVLRTAELQSRDPGELFDQALAAWLARDLSETERRAPYACFHAAWGDLTSKGAKAAPGGSQAPETASSVKSRAGKALADGDHAECARLMARAKGLEAAEEARRGRR